MKYLNTEIYRKAIFNEGELAPEWNDKPHRLVFDLCSEIERLQLILIEKDVLSVFTTQQEVFNNPYEEFIKPNIDKIKDALMLPFDFDKLFSSYLNTALWSLNDSDGIPLEKNYSQEDILPTSLVEMKKDLFKFACENKEHILSFGKDCEEKAGLNFWIRRNTENPDFFVKYGPVDFMITHDDSLFLIYNGRL